MSDLGECIQDLRLEYTAASEHERQRPGAGDVSRKHQSPQLEDADQRLAVTMMQEGKDRGQRVLGEQLLSAEHHDEKSDCIAQRDDQPPDRFVGDEGLELALNDER